MPNGTNSQGTKIYVKSAAGAYTQVTKITTWGGPGGQANVIDDTTLDSTAKEKTVGLRDEGQFTFGGKWDPVDAGQARLFALRAANTVGEFKVSYPDTSTTDQTFSGYVLGVATSGGLDSHVEVTFTVEITGEVTQA